MKKTLTILLFLVCSIPIVTIGAAATACYAGVCRTLQKKETGLVYRTFFADFRAAFRQATAGWLLELLAIVILLGDLWFDAAGRQREPDWSSVLCLPGVHLHLYGKTDPRRGRKMGHLTVTATDAVQARLVAIEAAAALGLPAF